MIVSNPNALERYTKQEMEKVGTAKGGWADVARALGSNPRGLRTENDITANWITRKGHGFGRAFRGGSDEIPTMRIVNSVRYADHALNGSARHRAIVIGLARMIENLETAVRNVTRGLKRAA